MHLVLIVIRLNNVLEILLFSFDAECFRCRISPPRNLIIPIDHESFTPLDPHRLYLSALVFSSVKVQANISIFALSKLKCQEAQVTVSLPFNAHDGVLCVCFLAHLSQNTVEVVHNISVSLICRYELNHQLSLVIWKILVKGERATSHLC